MWLAVIEIPHCVPDADGISITRELPVSATYRFPPARLSPIGVVSSALAAAVPFGEAPAMPVGLPATVYMSHWVIDWPHCDPVSAGTSCTRLLPKSAMYRSEVPGANAIPLESNSSAEVA